MQDSPDRRFSKSNQYVLKIHSLFHILGKLKQKEEHVANYEVTKILE